MGVCALQIRHHEAWTATKFGLPAFCASANAAASKGCVTVANAGMAAAVAAAAAKRTERRDSMGLPPEFDGRNVIQQNGAPAYSQGRRRHQVSLISTFIQRQRSAHFVPAATLERPAR